MINLLAWYRANPVLALGAATAFVLFLRTLWRIFAPLLAGLSPRWRSFVEGLAAAGPDLARSLVKLLHAFTGIDLAPVLLGPSGADAVRAELEEELRDLRSRNAALAMDNGALRRSLAASAPGAVGQHGFVRLSVLAALLGLAALLAVAAAVVGCGPSQHDPARHGTVRVYVAPGWLSSDQLRIAEELDALGALGPAFVTTSDQPSADVQVFPAAFDDCARRGAGRWIVGTRIVEVDPVCTPGDDAFASAIGHEIGHALGMRHICTASDIDVPADPCSPVGRGLALMNPRLRAGDGEEPGSTGVPTSLDLAEFNRVRPAR